MSEYMYIVTFLPKRGAHGKIDEDKTNWMNDL